MKDQGFIVMTSNETDLKKGQAFETGHRFDSCIFEQA